MAMRLSLTEKENWFLNLQKEENIYFMYYAKGLWVGPLDTEWFTGCIFRRSNFNEKKRGCVRRNHNGLKDTLACSLRATKLAGFVEPYKIARRGPLLCILLEAEDLWD